MQKSLKDKNYCKKRKKYWMYNKHWNKILNTQLFFFLCFTLYYIILHVIFIFFFNIHMRLQLL